MKDIVVVLHNIRSVYNVGSIFRTADGGGVKKIYLCGITPTPLVDRLGKPREDFTKVSLGAEKFVPWEKRRMTSKVIAELKGKGYRILMIEQSKKSIPYYKLKTTHRKLALVLGNEVRGLSPAILRLADKILEIPMRGIVVRNISHPRYLGHGKESLNVTISFGIVLFRILYPQ